MLKLQERPPDRLTDEEAERLRAVAEPDGFVCRLALGTGLRWGDLSRAQALDVERGSCEAGPGRFRRRRASQSNRRNGDYECTSVWGRVRHERTYIDTVLVAKVVATQAGHADVAAAAQAPPGDRPDPAPPCSLACARLD
jgi:integrase